MGIRQPRGIFIAFSFTDCRYFQFSKYSLTIVKVNMHTEHRLDRICILNKVKPLKYAS